MNRQDDNDNLLDRAAATMASAPDLGDFPEPEILQSVRSATSTNAYPIHHQSAASPHWFIRKLKSIPPLAKVAASLLIATSLLALAWAIFHAGPALAFANVAQRLHDAQTMTADISIQQDAIAMTGRLLFAAPGRFRVEFAGTPAEIVDMETGKIVLIDQANKSAIVMHVGEKDAPPEAVSFDFIEQLRNISHTAGKPVGESDINGIHARQFNAVQDGQPFTIWADAKTGDPLRIQSLLKLGGNEVKITLDRLTLGLPMNDALFSTTVPAGYSQQQATVSAATPSESDLVAFFKDYTTRTGVFPPSLIDFDKTLDPVVQKATPKSAPAARTLPSSDFLGIMLQAGRVMMFLNQLPGSADWHYAGGDAKASISNSATKPVFWYHTNDQATWRVIYADFHVDHLPASSASFPQSQETQPAK